MRENILKKFTNMIALAILRVGVEVGVETDKDQTLIPIVKKIMFVFL